MSKLNFHFLPFRWLPPAGGYVGPFALVRAAFCRDSAEQLLSRTVGAKNVVLCGSGKHSLYQIFQLLSARTSKRTIVLAAFTCPDIAAAAVRAGFKILAADIHNKTLEIDFNLLAKQDCSDVAAVVLSNLFGLADSVEESRKFEFVIDDACQAGLSTNDGQRVGTRGSVGVLSFGRGKFYCGVGGGLICFGHIRMHRQSE